MIFPNRPLFMVDRGWQRRKKRAGKLSPQDIHERELDLQPSRVPEVTITVAKEPAKDRSTSPPDKNNNKSTSPPDKQSKQIPIRSGQEQSAPIQFMEYEPPKPKQKQPRGSKARARNGLTAKQRPSRTAALMDPEIMRENLFVLKQSLPGTATALYSVMDPEVSAFQDFISYCKCLLGQLVVEGTARSHLGRSYSTCDCNLPYQQDCPAHLQSCRDGLVPCGGRG